MKDKKYLQFVDFVVKYHYFTTEYEDFIAAVKFFTVNSDAIVWDNEAKIAKPGKVVAIRRWSDSPAEYDTLDNDPTIVSIEEYFPLDVRSKLDYTYAVEFITDDDCIAVLISTK